MDQPLHPSKQNRSRETQARILQATAKLLETELFESISVRRIIGEANTSIGSFYGRFRDKKALLSVLYAEYEIQLEERLQELHKATQVAGSLQEVTECIVQHFIKVFGDVPHLSRALYEYATRSPQSSEAKDLAIRRRNQYSFLNEALLAFRNDMTHPNPERAVEMGLYFVVVTCRNRLMYPLAPQTRTLEISKKELSLELQRLLIGYLIK